MQRLTLDMDFDDPTDHHDHNSEGVSGKIEIKKENRERKNI